VAVYRRSRRHRFVLVLLTLTSVTVLTLDYRDSSVLQSVRSSARDAFAPIQSVAEKAVSPVANFFDTLTHFRTLKSENARLRQELDQARGDAARGADAERERQGLLALQGLDFTGGLNSVPARVVSNAPSNFQLTVTIDRGSDAKLAVGMPVVTNAGLVGRVIEVSKLRSTVLLITDPSSSVGVRLSVSGEQGVAGGAGAREPLRVDLVSTDAKVGEGEPVVTSGLQAGLFPPQIPVGRVRSAKVSPGALQQDLTVDPLVDLRRLEFVRVLLWRPTP
jgi:rod shape-determining protein MreC